MYYLYGYRIKLDSCRAYRIWFDTDWRLYQGNPVCFPKVCFKAARVFFKGREIDVRGHVTHIEEIWP